MRLLKWALVGSVSSGSVLAGTPARHEAPSPGEAARVEASMTPQQTALLAASTPSLAHDPGVEMWRPTWASPCASLGTSVPRSLVARRVVDEALRLGSEWLVATSSRVGDIKELQDHVRREQGRVANAADRFVTKEHPENYHQTPRFVPDRSLDKLAPSAANPQLARTEQLQDYMAELGAAASTLVETCSQTSSMQPGWPNATGTSSDDGSPRSAVLWVAVPGPTRRTNRPHLADCHTCR